MGAVAACSHCPPKFGHAALPPERGEVFTCLALNFAASVALVVCFPHLNTWTIWLLGIFVIILWLVITVDAWRDVVVDLLDPLLVVRSDTDKALPGRQRQHLRQVSWIVILLCAAVAMWDIMLHPVPTGTFEEPATVKPIEHNDDLPELWDQDSMMLLRWLPQTTLGDQGESRLLDGIASALYVDRSDFETQVFVPDHRLLVFKCKQGSAGSEHVPVHIRWKAALLAPEGLLEHASDSRFPATLNVTICLHAHATVETSQGEMPNHSDDFLRVVGESSGEAHDAYLAACDWWLKTLDAHYGEQVDTDHDLLDYSGDLGSPT